MFDGIDVSQYQGEIDWKKVKDHIDYAILRCGYGQDIPAQDDPTFKRNADECTRLNIPFGVYLYSYATDEIAALSEARHILRLIKNYKLDYPVYLDLEDPRIGRLTNEQIEKNCRVWVDEIEKNHYYAGFYASYYWWTSKLTGALFSKYTKWVARYAEQLGATGYQMWQYTDNGFVEGINAPVDRDIAYVNFSEIINNNQNNTTYKVGDEVSFDHVYISSDSTVPLIPYRNHGIITRIVANARNPYLIGDGLGWINNESIIDNTTYLSNPTYYGQSLVEALKQIGYDSSFDSRKNLAQMSGIDNYTGSAKQNLELLKLLKLGQLKQ
ncbi:MAG: glycoside hydrolase family 25 protein [Erysipelotrichaceae bacterium]|nr:glycoside hydrolase family 25 protein [Erysipelotrichaceae bacterium]